MAHVWHSLIKSKPLRISLSEKSVKISHRTNVHTVEKKRFVFGIDHDALYKQIEAYKQQSSNSSSQMSSSASLTQEQLDTLAEIRKQKLVEKKKHKAKKMKDDDITPKEFLLMRQLQKEQDEQYRTVCDAEDSQASERTWWKEPVEKRTEIQVDREIISLVWRLLHPCHFLILVSILVCLLCYIVGIFVKNKILYGYFLFTLLMLPLACQLF